MYLNNLVTNTLVASWIDHPDLHTKIKGFKS